MAKPHVVGAKRWKHGPDKVKLRRKKEENAMKVKQLEELDRAAVEFNPAEALEQFSDLPISENTKRGMRKAFFTKMTDIQIKSIPPCLKGKDVLGAARTGSGKTLSFLVPVLEILYRKKWGPQDGLGALIISPTRELAVQIFEVLKSIGGYHSFSAGLVIGGKNLKDERDRLSRMNILVATPGRLLQHLDQTFGFECDNLQILVLDEADRILDMGFARTLDALVKHLPTTRQTLLFSATQTQSVKDLARLSLKDPIHIDVKEEGSATATPKSLDQHYAVCELDKKLDVLWGFIKTHLKSKLLVFVSSGKQVRYIYETFRHMQPGIPLMHLHGRQKQQTRLATFSRFTSSTSAVLFATDIAARGLDFPSIDWVVQVDAPEDAETYIHRVGRTARYEKGGNGLLLLLPSEEEGMKAKLDEIGIVIDKIKIKQSKMQSIETQLQNLAFQEPEIKYLGQRAVVSYLRSIYVKKDKSIFQLDKLPLERFAASLGLPGVPKLKFMNKDAGQKNRSKSKMSEKTAADEDDSESPGSSSNSEDDIADEEELAKPTTVKTKYDRLFGRKNQTILSEHYNKLTGNLNDDDGEDFLTLKRANHDLQSEALPASKELSKRALKMGVSKKAMLKYKGVGQKLLFDDEGQGHEVYEMVDPETAFKGKDVLEVGREFARAEASKLQDADVVDKQVAKAKKQEKKRKRKEKEKGTREHDGDVPALASMDEDDGYVTPEFDLPPTSDDDSTPEEPPSKKRRDKGPVEKASKKSNVVNSLQDEEKLALSLLRKR